MHVYDALSLVASSTSQVIPAPVPAPEAAGGGGPSPGLEIVLMGLLVFIAAFARFNQLAAPRDGIEVTGPARAFMAFHRYVAFSLLFGLFFLVIYAAAVLCLSIGPLRTILTQAFSGMELAAPPRGSPAMIAGIALALLPNWAPIFRQVDTRLRRELQRAAGAPIAAVELANKLEGWQLRFHDKGALKVVRSAITDLDAVLKQGPASNHYKCAHILYLQACLVEWSRRDGSFHNFKMENQAVYEALEKRIAQIKEAHQSHGAAADDKRAHLMEHELVELRLQLLRFISCGALYCGWDETARMELLSLLGFAAPKPDRFDWLTPSLTLPLTAVTALLAAAVMAPFAAPYVRGGHVSPLLGPIAWRASEIALIHTAAIFTGLAYRHHEGQRRAESLGGHRRAGAFDVVFMIVEVSLGWFTGFLTVSVLGALFHPGEIPHLLQRSALFGIPTAAAAAAFAGLVGRKDEGRYASLIDALVQGAATMLATFVATSLAVRASLLDPVTALGLDPSTFPDLPRATSALQFAAVMVAGGVGACIGYVLPARYRMKIAVSERPSTRKVAVIGGGLAGLACASRLCKAGFEVIVYERGNKLGGRMASIDINHCEYDLGTQRFTAIDSDFREQVKEWCDTGHASEWNVPECEVHDDNVRERVAPPSATYYLGTPKMSAILEPLLTGCGVQSGTIVGSLRRDRRGWVVYDDKRNMLGKFDYVAVAVPAPVAAPLVREIPKLKKRAEGTIFEPCWTVLLAFQAPLEPVAPTLTRYDISVFNCSDILERAVCESHKPGRKTPPGVAETWVLQAKGAFSAEHQKTDPDQVITQLTKEFWRFSGLREQAPILAYAHFFEHARITSGNQDPSAPIPPEYEFDPSGVGLCGDWCVHWGAGYAFRSGDALARGIIEHWRPGSVPDLSELISAGVGA